MPLFEIETVTVCGDNAGVVHRSCDDETKRAATVDVPKRHTRDADEAKLVPVTVTSVPPAETPIVGTTLTSATVPWYKYGTPSRVYDAPKSALTSRGALAAPDTAGDVHSAVVADTTVAAAYEKVAPFWNRQSVLPVTYEEPVTVMTVPPAMGPRDGSSENTRT
jgi:hypothetical protein